LLGELNRLRDPETDERDDPSNLLDNSSGGKRIRKKIQSRRFWGIDGFLVLGTRISADQPRQNSLQGRPAGRPYAGEKGKSAEFIGAQNYFL